MTITREARALDALDHAQQLACMVRDDGTDTTGPWLRRKTRAQLEALTVVLAAMIPLDQTPEELLAWVFWEPTPVPHSPNKARPVTLTHIPDHIRGAHAAYERAKKQDAPIPADIREGERLYQRLRHAARRAKAAA